MRWEAGRPRSASGEFGSGGLPVMRATIASCASMFRASAAMSLASVNVRATFPASPRAKIASTIAVRDG